MLTEPEEVVGFLTSLIIFLRNIHMDMMPTEQNQDDTTMEMQPFHRVHNTVQQMDRIVSSILHDFRISNAETLLDKELGFWIKPRSKAWFSVFLCTEYDDLRWIANFRMTKEALFRLAAILEPYIQKQNTKFRKAIPARMRTAAAIYKLVQGASFLVVSEFFAIGESTVSTMLREVVNTINEVFKNKIQWPDREQALINMEEFKQYCDLPSVVGAIDGTHFNIAKPAHFSEDFFYFKTNGYSLVCQAVVNKKKQFLDVFVGLPGSLNDARVLRRSGLYNRRAINGHLIEGLQVSEEGFRPYLLGDKGYPLLPFIMIPHREGRLTVLEQLYNRKHKRGRSVVEHTFGILKQSFRELMKKSELHVTFLPDVVMACCYLYNVLLGQDPYEVERLIKLL
jgi:hypothetical protein